MKRLILLLASLCLIACSDDDGAANKQRTLFLDTFGIALNGGGGAFEFTYNDDKELETIALGANAFEMNYKDGKMATLTTYANDIKGAIYKFGYDDNGILESIKINDADPLVVTYDSGENKYTIEGLDRSFTLNDKNDIIAAREGTQEILMTHDTNSKGPMYNVQGNYYLATFLVNFQYLYMASRHPVTEIANITSSNTFNTDSYLHKSVLTDENSEDVYSTVYYTYIQL